MKSRMIRKTPEAESCLLHLTTWIFRGHDELWRVSASVSPRCGRFHEPRIHSKPAGNSDAGAVKLCIRGSPHAM